MGSAARSETPSSVDPNHGFCGTLHQLYRMRNAPDIWIIRIGILLISLGMVFGPFFSPDEFSWVRHSTSEQAGQHLSGAWIMRLGFGAYGVAVLLAATIDRRKWSLMRAALALFGLGLVGAAIWSNAPIISGVPADMHEDWLHSVASGVVGTAFAFACAAKLFAPGGDRRDAMAWAGLIIAVVIPVFMGLYPDIRGLLQRSMFVFSFVFVAREFAKG